MPANFAAGERQRARESNGENLLSVLEVIGDQCASHALLLCDLHGRITGWFLAAAELFGWPADAMLGESLWALATQDDATSECRWPEVQHAQLEGTASCDRWFRTQRGEPFWGMGTVVRLPGGPTQPIGYAILLQDATPLKQKLESLEAHVTDSINASRAKDRFIARLSHELRNPLAAIVFGVEALRQAKNLDADAHQVLDIIARQSESLHRLVDDLLDASRLARDKLEVVRFRIPINQVVRAAVETCVAQVTQRRQVLTVTPADSSVWVDCDPQRMQQVFVNLLQNAIKFTPEEGQIHVATGTADSEVLVCVSDSGVGIDPEVLPQIFEMFTQCGNEQDLSRKGLGIGLSVSKEIVALHGGRIEARSAGRGKGAEFVVRLPRADYPD